MELPDDWYADNDGQSLILDPVKVAAEIERLRALVMLGDFSGLRPNSDSFKLVQQIRREQSTGEQSGDANG